MDSPILDADGRPFESPSPRQKRLEDLAVRARRKLLSVAVLMLIVAALTWWATEKMRTGDVNKRCGERLQAVQSAWEAMCGGRRPRYPMSFTQDSTRYSDADSKLRQAEVGLEECSDAVRAQVVAARASYHYAVGNRAEASRLMRDSSSDTDSEGTFLAALFLLDTEFRSEIHDLASREVSDQSGSGAMSYVAGVCYLMDGDRGRAIASLRSAVMRLSGKPERHLRVAAHVKLALAHAQCGEFDASDGSFRNAVDEFVAAEYNVDQTYADFERDLTLLVSTFVAVGKAQLIRTPIDDILRKDPESFPALSVKILLSAFHENSGDGPAEAVRLARVAVAVEGAGTRGRQLLARSLCHLAGVLVSDPAQGKAIVDLAAESLRFEPNNDNAHSLMAIGYYHQGDFQLATEAIDGMRSLHLRPDIELLRGACEFKLGRRKEAKRSYLRALTCLYDLRALESVSDFSDHDPLRFPGVEAAAFGNISEVCFELGQEEDARRAAHRALSLALENKEAIETLRKLEPPR